MATPPGHRSANRYSSRDARIPHLAGRSCSHASTGYAGATAKKAGAGTTQGSNRERRAPDPSHRALAKRRQYRDAAPVVVTRAQPRHRHGASAQRTMTHAGRHTIRTLVAALLLGGLADSPAAAA